MEVEMLKDNGRVCIYQGCNNLGEWREVNHGVVRRRKLCGTHRKAVQKRRGNICEYCGWEGPCDAHRPVAGSIYSKENVRTTCPNCHRLISMGLIEDKFLIL